MGIGRGVGTTHLSIMLGNFIANGLGKRVAILELNKNNTFSEIKEQRCAKVNNTCFEVNGIDFYENVSYDDLSKTMDRKYNYVILDISSRYILGKNQFLKSNKRIIVGSLSKWKVKDYLNYFKDVDFFIQSDICKYVSLSKDIDTYKIIKRIQSIKIDSIPFEENPFCIEAKNMKWMSEILE